MQGYLALLQPIITWIVSGVALLAALAFAWTTLVEWANDPDEVDLIPLILRAIGYALLALLCRNAAMVVSSIAGSGRPTLAGMVQPVLGWLTAGVLTLGAVVGLWLILRSWLWDPHRYHWTQAMLTLVGVAAVVMVVRSAGSSFRAIVGG